MTGNGLPAPVRFINPHHAGDSDVVGIGDDLRVETLRWAYRQGVFPWPEPGYPLLWFCPRLRAILDFDALHVPRRLARLARNSSFTFTIDAAFPRVIAHCRTAYRPDQRGTWITPALLSAYVALHDAGDAHSAEAWDADGNLVGGVYGVCVGGAFAGESMFHTRPNASKLALLHLIAHLRGGGLTWIDIQMMTPHMETLGATHLPRAVFLDRLDATHALDLTLFGARPPIG